MWDENDPEDWTRWETQHNGLREIRPPYVYHVVRFLWSLAGIVADE